MRILKSALIVVAAGISTVLLALAARAGLDAANIEIPYLRESLIPAICAFIVILGFTLIRGRRPFQRPPFPVEFHHAIIANLIAVACHIVLSIRVYPAFGEAESWWTDVSLGGFLTAGIMASVEWAALDAAKANRSQQAGEGEP